MFCLARILFCFFQIETDVECRTIIKHILYIAQDHIHKRLYITFRIGRIDQYFIRQVSFYHRKGLF